MFASCRWHTSMALQEEEAHYSARLQRSFQSVFDLGLLGLIGSCPSARPDDVIARDDTGSFTAGYPRPKRHLPKNSRNQLPKTCLNIPVQAFLLRPLQVQTRRDYGGLDGSVGGGDLRQSPKGSTLWNPEGAIAPSPRPPLVAICGSCPSKPGAIPPRRLPQEARSRSHCSWRGFQGAEPLGEVGRGYWSTGKLRNGQL